MTMRSDALPISDAVVRQFLGALDLRCTVERLEALRVILVYPGLSLGALGQVLAPRGIDRRTIHRLLRHVWSPEGCRARWDLLGPGWVCWGCGRLVARAATDPPVVSFRGLGILPLDLGGYCVNCQAYLANAPHSRRREDLPPGLRPGRSASTFANRRVTLVPIGALYQNPSLMRELLGSSRRLHQRDYVVANLAENPKAGPRALHQALHDELPVVPALRSVKRISSRLHSPKAHLLFASLGAIGWACLGCGEWGPVPSATLIRRWAPPGFTATDVRALCPACQRRDQSNRHDSADSAILSTVALS